jgi:hypothetical protein
MAEFMLVLIRVIYMDSERRSFHRSIAPRQFCSARWQSTMSLTQFQSHVQRSSIQQYRVSHQAPVQISTSLKCRGCRSTLKSVNRSPSPPFSILKVSDPWRLTLSSKLSMQDPDFPPKHQYNSKGPGARRSQYWLSLRTPSRSK